MISNSGHDERGKYSGGKAGDQTGGEWAIIPWYSRPWTHVLRHPDKKVREQIALNGERAANNNKIGYDQGERYTYWEHLAKSNYDPAQITIACEADCSAGVLSNVKAAGYTLNNSKLKAVNQNGYTGNMRSILKNAGFEVLTDKKYLTSDKYLLRGDILLYENHHTATNLADGAGSNGGTVNESVNAGGDIKLQGNVARGQAWLNSNYGTLITKHCGKKLTVDNSYGPASRAAALCVWKDLCNRRYGTSLTPSNSNFLSSCIEAAKNVNVRRGDSGTFVYLIEFILSGNKRYYSSMDAIFGGNLENSVISFQNENGLTPDGVVGSKTWNKLFN